MSPQERAAETRRRNRARRLIQLEDAFASAGADVDTAKRLGDRVAYERAREALLAISRERHRLRWPR